MCGSPSPRALAKAAGAELLLTINASPYEQKKQRAREAVLRRAGRTTPACPSST